ncbi:Mth938-like domain-containing protein [Legionella sp. W05-934-2]|jgi:uncharacterized protein|uniref:Mth938-like domain-containing protein n=1 Tax=Legionella sp. W05-934-2 TaxID=1198649 RepID=UPI003461A829
MQINLERPDSHSIQSYSDQGVVINDKTYRSSLIVSQQTIDDNWQQTHIHLLNEDDVSRILIFNPEIVIIGHPSSGQFPNDAIRLLFSQKKVGLECMDIGAACRTFNVLLSELRNVTLALIIPAA